MAKMVQISMMKPDNLHFWPCIPEEGEVAPNYPGLVNFFTVVVLIIVH